MGGVTIHPEHPFRTPEPDRSPVRRLRGRLTAPVTVWTSHHAGRSYGLTVSSMLVADGEPGRVLGLIDPDADLWDSVRDSGAFAVSVLDWRHRQLADAFAGVAPAPGGVFRLADWTETEWGPVLDSTGTWAGCRLADPRPRDVGWALLVEGIVEHVQLTPESVTGEAGPEDGPLLHHRGRYHRL